MSAFDPYTVPTPDVLRRVRELCNLSQEQAAALAGVNGRARWSEYERGKHAMDVARWELLLLKLDLHPTYIMHAKPPPRRSTK